MDVAIIHSHIYQNVVLIIALKQLKWAERTVPELISIEMLVVDEGVEGGAAATFLGHSVRPPQRWHFRRLVHWPQLQMYGETEIVIAGCMYSGHSGVCEFFFGVDFPV